MSTKNLQEAGANNSNTASKRTLKETDPFAAGYPYKDEEPCVNEEWEHSIFMNELKALRHQVKQQEDLIASMLPMIKSYLDLLKDLRGDDEE